MTKHKVMCTKKLNFCAGHRVLGHEGKCAQPHGHEYRVFATAVRDDSELDDIGRVIDFSVIKVRLGVWLDQNVDHGFILSSNDGDAIQAISGIPGNKMYVMPENPTAENIAKHLLIDICPILFSGTGVKIVKIRVWETETCYADVSL